MSSFKFSQEFTPIKCTVCKEWFKDNDLVEMIAEHPFLGELYGPYYFHDSCWHTHHWNK